MDFPERGAAPDEEANPGAMTEFAAGVFARQPFRGYELRAALASTDRTAVFKARDNAMERTVAIKVLRPCRERAGVVEEFFSLAGSIARLRCPGAARGLDAGRGDGDFFLVYEFVRGESLAHRVNRLQAGRLGERESLKVVTETARVLQSLFEHGHPHGHVTPGNIIQGEGGGVRLTDVGFAWNLAWPDDAAAFREHPHFLPPERIAGECNVDIRGDLYSLGAIWFRLLTGRPVFQGETPEETLRLHLDQKPEAPHRLDAKISESTSSLVRWLLEKDRDARPRTPKEFLRKLASHPLLAPAGAEGGDAPPEGSGERSGPPAPFAVSAGADGEPIGGILSIAREVEALIRGDAPGKPAAPEGKGAGPEADGRDGGGRLGDSFFERSGGLRLFPPGVEGRQDARSPAGDAFAPELSETELFEPGQVLSLPRPPASERTDGE